MIIAKYRVASARTMMVLLIARILQLNLVDHVIIGRASAERAKDYASLRELGYFYS